MDKQVVNTILQQMGGQRFLAMTGATVSGEDKTLIIRLPRYRSILITLTDDDLYKMEDVKMNAKTYEVTRKTIGEGLYNDQIQDAFTRATGLYCTL